MARIGRPASGRRKLPVSTTVDRDLADWLFTKENRASVVNHALRKAMIEERKNEPEFIRRKLIELRKERDELVEDILQWDNRLAEIQKEDKELESGVENVLEEVEDEDNN